MLPPESTGARGNISDLVTPSLQLLPVNAHVRIRAAQILFSLHGEECLVVTMTLFSPGTHIC